MPVRRPAAEATPAKLNVYPADVHLNTNRDRQSIIVQAVYENGLTEDVTDMSMFTLANPALAKLDGKTLYPQADGKTELTVSHAGLNVKVPVEVVQAQADQPISFQLDVMPVFMKSGCNMGSCHGAGRGKDGFRAFAVWFRSARRSPPAHAGNCGPAN